jgi:hypothetical protein
MWEESRFREAVAGNTTVAGTLRSLECAHSGASYRQVYKQVERLGLDTSHWKKAGCDGPVNKIPLDEILIENSAYQDTSALRKRLIREGVLVETCAECGIGPTWNGRRLVLQLDHINGERSDNRRENLRLLCPNCHSQTPTFSGRKNKRITRCPCGIQVRNAWPSVQELFCEEESRDEDRLASR